MKSNFARLIDIICDEEKIERKSFSDDWSHKLTRNGRTAFITGYQFALNPASSKELAQDKALTYSVLDDAGVPTAVHEFLPSFTEESEKAFPYQAVYEACIKEAGEVVLKDNYGTGGNKVFRISDPETYVRTLKKIWDASYAASLSPFYDIEEEVRVVILDGEGRLFIKKERQTVIGDGSSTVEELVSIEPEKKEALGILTSGEKKRVPAMGEKVYLNWKHNLGQGATGVVVEDEDLKKELTDIARSAQKALGLRFCSVDIVRVNGKRMVLEVNGGVMMEHFAGQSEACFETAKSIYRDAILRML